MAGSPNELSGNAVAPLKNLPLPTPEAAAAWVSVNRVHQDTSRSGRIERR